MKTKLACVVTGFTKHSQRLVSVNSKSQKLLYNLHNGIPSNQNLVGIDIAASEKIYKQGVEWKATYVYYIFHLSAARFLTYTSQPIYPCRYRLSC